MDGTISACRMPIKKDKLKSLSFIPEQGLGQVQGSGRR